MISVLIFVNSASTISFMKRDRMSWFAYETRGNCNIILSPAILPTEPQPPLPYWQFQA